MQTAMKLPDEIEYAVAKIEAAGYRAYLVGGAVRDHFLGKKTHDYDLTTDALPDVIKEIFRDHRLVEAGIRHGTVGVVLGTYTAEITAMRADGDYLDGRHPASVQFGTSLPEDLSRRDFTVNAVAYRAGEGFIDPYGGIADIKNKILRTVGDPEKRFSEDALRILRLLRFSAVLGFSPEKETRRAATDLREKLSAVSKERIFSEICKMLTGEYLLPVLTDFSPVICTVIPELSAAVGYDQNNKNHSLTLYEHIAAATANTPPLLSSRLAMLLHDIGKPAVMKKDEHGVSHYKGHEQKGAEMAAEILRRLRAPKTLSHTVVRKIALHDYRIPEGDGALLQFIRLAGGYRTAEEILWMQRGDILAQSPDFRFRLAAADDRIRELHAAKAAGEPVSLRDLMIDGRDAAAAGLHGEAIGRALEDALSAVMAGTCPNTKEDLCRFLSSCAPSEK